MTSKSRDMCLALLLVLLLLTLVAIVTLEPRIQANCDVIKTNSQIRELTIFA